MFPQCLSIAADESPFDVVVINELMCFLTESDRIALVKHILEDWLAPDGLLLIGDDGPESFYVAVVDRLWPNKPDPKFNSADVRKLVEKLG